MKNKSKTNWKIDENTTEKFNRYGIRKYNVGAASVAILSGLFFLGGADAQAAETGSSQTAAQAVATESGSSATANTWEKAITTVVEKEKSTNVAATGTENKPVETVAPKAVEAKTTPKETVATAPKAETKESSVVTSKAETREASVETPKAETREATPAPKAEVATANNTANVGSTRSVDNGYSGFRAAPAPTNQPVTNLGNNTVFTDISRGSHSFRGNGNSRGGNPIHFDVTTTRVGNRVEFSIAYSGPGEFVNNNFILDKGNGFGEPSRATVTTNRLRDQTKDIRKGANFVSHSSYSLTSAVETNTNQTIRFSLPIANPNGDLSVRLRPVTFNVGQGESGSATSNDPYSNSNYYFREKPLYLDANPLGAASTHKVTEEIDFQTVYLPTSKLAEGQTRLVREGVNGRRETTYKVHRLGQETLLGLPISRAVTQEAQPRIMQIGVAKELIDTVKPRVDQNKVGDTNNLTFYLDNDGNGVYTEGVDELIQKVAIKDGAKGDQGERGLTGAKGEKGDRGERGLTGAKGDQGERGLTGAKGEKGDRGERGLTGAKGEKGDQGERGLTGAKGEKGDQGERGLTGAKGEKGDRGERGLAGVKGEKGDQGERGLTGAKGEKGDRGETGAAGRDGVTPTVTVKDNKEDGTHTITINDGRGNVTNTVVRDGFDGDSPLVSTQRNEADKTTTVIFYYDKNGNNELDADDEKLREVVIADGAKGEKGDKGATPKVTTARGADGRSTDITFTVPGEEPVVANIKDGKDGRTPTIDLNALAEAALRINNQRSGRVRRALADAPSIAPAEKPREGTLITAYFDNNGNGRYDEGIDELIAKQPIYNGTDGANGAAGSDGRNGAELLSGPNAPTANDGKNGDTYIDATTGDVYKKEDGNWKTIGNIRGPQGFKGDKGQDGAQGPQGIRGEAGPQGLQGRDGREGIQGPAGRDGRDGAAGRDGRDGRDGKDVLNGKVDPTTEGKDGDKYVNTESGDVFVKNNGTWEKEGNIKGPKGDKGEQGLQGRDGREGVQGPAGRDGRDGAQGPQGPQGPQGLKGEKGEDGKTPEVTVKPGKDGNSSDITFTVPGKNPVTVNVKNGENGLNGKTPKVDLLRVEGQNGNPSHTIVTFYTDENGDGRYTPGTDELLGSEMIKDGAKGADGHDGKSLVAVKTGTETKVYQEDPANPGQPLNPEKPLAVIKDGLNGVSPTVTAVRKEDGNKGVEITIDNHDGSQPTKVLINDGAKGEAGQDGNTPTVTTQRGADGRSTIVTFTTPGKDPVSFVVKDGKDGRTPFIDLNALAEAVRRGAGLAVNPQHSTSPRSARRARSVGDNPDEVSATTLVSSPTPRSARRVRSVGANPDEVTALAQPAATDSAGSQPTTTDSTATQPETNQPAGEKPKVIGTRITAYFDNNGNGKYDPGVDEPISSADILNGNDGAAGAAGEAGHDGRNGAELLSGVTAPTAKDGKDGDTFIDANTGDVYKKENGSWNKIGNIRGPQGTAGEKGATGEKGDNGKDGRAPKIKVEDITSPSRSRRATDATTTPARNGVRITVYDDVNNNGVFDDGDTVLNSKDIYNGIDGRDGSAPTITTKDNGDGTHTITVQNPDGSEATTVVKDGKDGKTANITTTENPDGSHTITVTNPDGSTKETVVKNGKDGKTPKVEVTDNNDGTHTVKVTDGDGNVTNAIIKDGKDGKAATATTTKNPDGSHTVTITNPDGTKNEFVVKNGRDGVDGRTPTASVRDNRDGSHTIVITNPEGVTTETTVRDGKSPKVTITDEQNGTHKITVLNGDGTTTETIIKDGKSPVATVRDNQDGTYTIRVENGNGTVSETTVRDGKSPTAKVVDNGDGTHTVTIVNSDGTTTTTTVRDGKSPKLEVIDNNNGSHTIKVTGADGKETNTTIFDGKSPKANIVDNGDGTHTLTIVDSDGREYKSVIKDGKDGKDGVSPTVTVKNNNDGTHTVTITNPDGSKTDMVIKDGKDGKSPKVSVEDNGDGSHTITIINSDGTVTKTVVKDGKDGRDGKDGKCGCQDKPVTPSNDKPVPPVADKPEGPKFAMPEPPVHELPEYTGGVTPLDPPVYEKPEFNSGVPGIPEVNEGNNADVPGMPTPPVHEVPEMNIPTPSDNGNIPPVNEVPREGKVPPTNGTTPPPAEVSREKEVPTENTTPVVPERTPVPETDTTNPNSYLPETGTQSDYIYIVLASGILMSLYVGKRQED